MRSIYIFCVYNRLDCAIIESGETERQSGGAKLIARPFVFEVNWSHNNETSNQYLVIALKASRMLHYYNRSFSAYFRLCKHILLLFVTNFLNTLNQYSTEFKPKIIPFLQLRKVYYEKIDIYEENRTLARRFVKLGDTHHWRESDSQGK